MKARPSCWTSTRSRCSATSTTSRDVLAESGSGSRRDQNDERDEPPSSSSPTGRGRADPRIGHCGSAISATIGQIRFRKLEPPATLSTVVVGRPRRADNHRELPSHVCRIAFVLRPDDKPGVALPGSGSDSGSRRASGRCPGDYPRGEGLERLPANERCCRSAAHRLDLPWPPHASATHQAVYHVPELSWPWGSLVRRGSDRRDDDRPLVPHGRRWWLSHPARWSVPHVIGARQCGSVRRDI